MKSEKYWEESWRLEETCCHSDSSGKPLANAVVKNTQRSKIIMMIIRGWSKTIQATALLKLARILRRVLETEGDLLSLRLQWKTIGKCWCENLARSNDNKKKKKRNEKKKNEKKEEKEVLMCENSVWVKQRRENGMQKQLRTQIDWQEERNRKFRRNACVYQCPNILTYNQKRLFKLCRKCKTY